MSRYKVDREQVTSQGIRNFIAWHWRGRGMSFYKSVIGVGANCKNHDELINYTVRVNNSTVFKVRVQIVVCVPV